MKNIVSPRRTRQSGGVSSSLFQPKTEPNDWKLWSIKEEEVLLCAIAAKYEKWPQMKPNHKFWQDAADIINKQTKGNRKGRH